MRRRIGAALLTFACVVLAGASEAAPAAAYRFDIPAKPASEALIDFAIQANISIGGSARCTGPSQALVGAFSIEAGLTRLLAASSCRFKVVAPNTIRIVEAQVSASPVRAAPRPTAPPPVAERSEPVPLAEVIVTATKRRALIEHLAESVSAIGGTELKDSGAVDASDLGSWLAGLTTTNLGPGRDKILLRGLSDGAFTGRTESTVGIYLDDTPITFNAPDPDLRLVDVQSVEVLRGPQGFLYGGGSISGVYRIVTQKPALNETSGSLLVGGSLTEAGAPSDEGEAVLNLPVIRDVAALRLVLYGEQDGGYIDNVALRESNVDGTSRVGGRAALRVLVSPDWTVTLGATHQQITTNDTQFVTPSLGRLHVANQINESSINDFTQGSLTVEHAGSWGDFKSTTAVTRHQFDSQTDASTALPLFGLSATRVGAYDEPTSITMVVEEAVLTSPNTGRLQWLLGAFGATSTEGTRPTVSAHATTLAPAELLYSETRTDRLDRLAVFGQASYALTDRLTIEAGLRLSNAVVSTDSLVVAPQLGAQRRFSGSTSGQGLSPKVSVKYQASHDLMLYALAADGRRSGGYNTGGPIGTIFVVSGPGPRRHFAPDHLWNFETGLKATLFDERLSLRSALFYDVWDRIQSDQFLPSGLSYTANAGNGRNYGSETEVAFRASDRLTVRLSALINAPELTKADPGFTTGVGLPGVPDVSGGAQATYEWPVGAGLSAAVSAQTQYVGRSRLLFNPVNSPRMGGYELNQLSAQLKGSGWRLSAYVINPTNASGDTFSYGDPFNFRQIAEVTPQRPLTLRATLGVDF